MTVNAEARCEGLRVGYVLTHYPRLAQTFISGEIEGVERAGVRVRVFAMNPPAETELIQPGAVARMERTTYLKPRAAAAVAALVRRFLRHPIGVARVANMALVSGGGSVHRMFRRLAHPSYAALVADAAHNDRLEYLHAQFGLAPATIGWLASALTGIAGRKVPFGFTIHGFHDFVDAAESRLDLKARDASQVLCVSDFTRSQLFLVTEPELWPRFAVARCGIDLTSLAYRDPPRKPASLTILAVGRMSAEKGFNVLIQSVGELKRRGAPQRLVILGDGPLRSSLERAAVDEGVGELIEFVGELGPPAVREYLERADLFCLPSFSEGSPISIMEAMAVGVPVVTTWIAGIPELAEHEVTALTVPPARSDTLAEALARLATDPPLRLRLARAARRRVEEQHDQVRCSATIAQRFYSAVLR